MRITRWNPAPLLDAITVTMAQRMTVAAAIVERDVKTSMVGGGNPHVPSLPGNPPHVDTGSYRARIYSVVVTIGRRVRGFVVSPSRQARALEFGYAPGGLAPRPHLRPALVRNIPRLRSILLAPLRFTVRGV